MMTMSGSMINSMTMSGSMINSMTMSGSMKNLMMMPGSKINSRGKKYLCEKKKYVCLHLVPG